MSTALGVTSGTHVATSNKSRNIDVKSGFLCLAAIFIIPMERFNGILKPDQQIKIPLNYGPRLDYRDPREVGDVKIVWELGRMQHLVPLSQAWFITGNAKYASSVVRDIESWIAQCPHMRGVHWVSPMETALRLLSWTWAISLLTNWDGLTDIFCELVAKSVYQQLRFINERYSLYSSANNHLTAEATGVFVTACFWDRFNESARFRRTAKAHLIWCCEPQHTIKGVNREQAFSYQIFVWNLLVIAGLAAKSVSDPLPQSYWHRLKQSARFLSNVSDQHANIPNIGDEDGGVAIDLGSTTRLPELYLELLNNCGQTRTGERPAIRQK